MDGERQQILDRFVACVGPQAYNRLIDSRDATRSKGRLRFWQEKLFRRFNEEGGIEIATVEQFLQLFDEAERKHVSVPPLTKEAFLADANGLWYSTRRDEIPLEWFAEAWRTIPFFRENLSYELKRYASKWGEMAAPDILTMLAQFLSRDEVVALYEYVRDHAGREKEWRAEFEAAFPEQAVALPPVRA